MARLFTAASSEFLEIDSAPVTAAPLTMACWARSTTIAAGNATLVFVGDKDSNSNYFMLYRNAGNPRVEARDISLTGTGTHQSNFTANTWNHFAGLFVSTVSRRPYLNGVAASAPNTTSVTPAGSDRISVGRQGRLSAVNYWDGNICEVGVWNVVLTDAEIAALAAGVSPARIRPGSLVFYAPVWGADSPEADLSSGARDLTVTGTTASAHGPVQPWILPPPRFSHTAAVAAPPASSEHKSLLLRGVG